MADSWSWVTDPLAWVVAPELSTPLDYGLHVAACLALALALGVIARRCYRSWRRASRLRRPLGFCALAFGACAAALALEAARPLVSLPPAELLVRGLGAAAAWGVIFSMISVVVGASLVSGAAEDSVRPLVTAEESLLVVDMEGEVLSWNAGAASLFGRLQSQTIGQRMEDSLPEAIAERIRLWLRQAQQGRGTAFRVEYIEADRSREIGLRLMPLADAEERVSSVAVFFEDLAERRSLEDQSLRETAERFEDFYERSPDMQCSVAVDSGRIESCNLTLCERLGHPRRALIGRSFVDLAQAKSRDKARSVWERFGREGEVQGEILTLSTAEGRRLPVSLSASAGRDGGGRLRVARVSLQDISEIAAAQTELEEANAALRRRFRQQTQRLKSEQAQREGAEQEVSGLTTRLRERVAEIEELNAELEARVVRRTRALEEAVRELESFSYSVSHDLRAPVRHIAGFTGLLRKQIEAESSPDVRRYLENIDNANQRMRRLIEDLLSFSRTGQRELKLSEVDTSDMVTDLVAELMPNCEGRVVRWELGVLPRVMADAGLLRIALSNLLDNAVKFTAQEAEARIAVSCEGEDDAWVFKVQDNGVGFSKEYADRLFGVFQRLHNQDDFPGSGIGLATVRRIARRHRGEAWAEGEPGAGATLYLKWPRDPRSRPPTGALKAQRID